MAKLRKFSGVVSKFHYERGYGFARINELIGRKAYMHVADFEEAQVQLVLRVGTKIACYLENAPQGLKCIRSEIVRD